MTSLTSFAFKGPLDGVVAPALPAAALDDQPRYAPPSAAQQEAFEVITTRAAFDALEPEWNALFARGASCTQVFQSFNWCWHWANHYLPKHPAPCPLAIVTARRDGQLIMIWPLVVTRAAGLKQVAWLGDPVSQYGDIVVDGVADQADLIRRGWRYVATTLGADIARLTKVRADAAVAPLLAEIGARITATEEAPFADLKKAGSIETFLSRFNAKTLKNQRRKTRRLEERGALSYDYHDTSTDETPARDAIIAGLTLKRAWLNDKGLVSRAFADSRIEAFFAAAVTSRERPAGVAVSMLRTGGEIADHHIMVDCKDRRALHVLGYNLKFERVGPGNIHLEHAIARAFAQGVATFDFLAPRHDYKMDWADGVIAVNDHAIGLTPRGRVYAAVYLGMIREGMKRTLKALPKSVTRSIAGLHGKVRRTAID